MAKTLTIIKQRFVKGLREAPYEFVAPLLVAARGGRAVARKVTKSLDDAMTEARAKADRPVAHK
ncbi:hypothetical protein AB7849_15210 [Rhodanobacter sp. 115]|uniref:hypothetical protein n=1 Tax=Rhodanobacter sp. FW021-MT20 TaxID=1162282 RepID=UPI0034E4A76A